jgi:superfamily II DNA or RNA helicase
MQKVTLSFQGGTLRLAGLAPDAPLAAELPRSCAWDPREGVFRLPAVAYAKLVLWLRARRVEVVDEARGYEALELAPSAWRTPFPHQQEAIEAWAKASYRGVVVLPTGAGKTHVAELAIASRKRSALVVVPTLDLMNQWYDGLATAFGAPVGLVGGGYHDVRELTVTTYDSAYLQMEHLGRRFGLVIFDECHHLPSESYAIAARMCLAPYRLGLTATPERTDGKESLFDELVGPIVYRRDITDLEGSYLAPYDVERLEVPLSAEERAAYDEARGVYVGYLRSAGIRFGEPGGWGRFLLLSSQSDEGRRAFHAYRLQRKLALAAPGKLDVLGRLLHLHRDGRTIVFTEDNATVYAISRRFLLPSITHQTKIKERSEILAAFNDGSLTAVVTSKVLNEGVNVPEANVAIVLSGSGSVREHVQRLGRVLRKTAGKRAVLYELVASGTAEERTSDRRREHVAYK